MLLYQPFHILSASFNFKLREVIYKQQFGYPQLETAHTAQFQATATLLFSAMKEGKLVTNVAKNQDLLPV